MKNIKLKHPTVQHPDGKIRLLDTNTKIIYLYLDESKNYKIETDKKILRIKKYILDSE